MILDVCVYVCVCVTICRIMLRDQTHPRNDQRRMILSRATHTFITYSHKMHHMRGCVCGHTQDCCIHGPLLDILLIFKMFVGMVCGSVDLDMGVRCETDPSLCRTRKTHSSLYKKDTFESLQQRHIRISTTKTHSSLYVIDMVAIATFKKMQ